MSLNVLLRCIFFSFLLALPAPFIFEWVSQAVAVNIKVTQFFTVYLLVFLGCLMMGLTGTKQESGEETEPEGEDVSGHEKGTVKWFNVAKGFGFITRSSGEDIFVHYRSIKGTGRRSLSEGQKVRFIVTEGEKGLQADDVSVDR